jgi:hypothetical protein
VEEVVISARKKVVVFAKSWTQYAHGCKQFRKLKCRLEYISLTLILREMEKSKTKHVEDKDQLLANRCPCARYSVQCSRDSPVDYVIKDHFKEQLASLQKHSLQQSPRKVSEL